MAATPTEKYYPRFSTRAFELVAYERCDRSIKKRMTPIVTLTRQREAESFDESFEAVVKAAEGNTVIVDFDLTAGTHREAAEAGEGTETHRDLLHGRNHRRLLRHPGAFRPCHVQEQSLTPLAEYLGRLRLDSFRSTLQRANPNFFDREPHCIGQPIATPSADMIAWPLASSSGCHSPWLPMKSQIFKAKATT